MRIKSPQADLNSAISIALRAVSSRSILPILSGVRLSTEDGRLQVAATDLEITLECSIEVTTTDKGKAILPARILGEAVKGLPNEEVELSIDHDAGQAEIACGKTRYEIKSMPLEDYPQLPAMENGKTLTVIGEALSEAIRQVIKAVSRDEARPTLGGVLVSIADGSMNMVATDSYRLAVKGLDIEGEAGDIEIIIPARAVEELGRLTGEDKIEMGCGENQVHFKAGEVSLVSRLIEGQFPKYEQLLPDSWNTRVKFEADELASAIKRVAILSSSSAIVRFVVGGNSIKVRTYAQDVGSAEDEAECTIEGDPIETAFNAQYIIDGLAAVQGGPATIEFTSPLKPAVLRPAGQDDYLYLIMPVRLS